MNHKAINRYILLSFISILGLFVLLVATNIYTVLLLEKNQQKKDNITQALISSYQVQLQTEKLLTTFNFDHEVPKWKESFRFYQQNISKLYDNSEVQFSKVFKKNHKEMETLLDEIATIITSDFFDITYKQDKPLFERYNDTRRNKDIKEFEPIVEELIDKIAQLRDNQQITINELKQINLINSKIINEQIAAFDQNNRFFNLLIFVVLIILVAKTFKRLHYFTENLKLSKNILENIINSIPIRIFWKNIHGEYKGANKLFLQDAGLESTKDLIDKTDFNLPWTKEETKRIIRYDKEVIYSKEPVLDMQEEITTFDKDTKIINISKVPFYKEKEIIGVIGIFEDITKKVEYEQNLKKQELQIIQQNRLIQMGEMLSMIAHQWRQPLNIISLQVLSIQQKILMGKQIKMDTLSTKCENILKNIHYLSDTIEDFRDFFKPDKGKVVTNAGEIIKETIAMIEPTLESHGITLVRENLCGQDKELYKNEIKQVLLNILKNSLDAIVEHDIQDPTIWIESQCSSGDDNECTITLKDNAGGIPEGIIEKIFDPYFSTKQEKNGTGLGLYMSKVIITEHCKGSIECFNEENGVVFQIKI